MPSCVARKASATGVLAARPVLSGRVAHSVFFTAKWSFKSAEAARQSLEAIYEKFVEYGAEDDFVGMDIARKYLHINCTN